METIDAKDLAVGRYVQREDGTLVTITRVIGRNVNGGYIRSDNDEKHISYFSLERDDLQSIPITPEWLEKLGFVHDGTTCYDMPGKLPYVNRKAKGLRFYGEDPNETIWELAYSDQRNYVTIQVRYVHRLQALIWQLERVWLTLSPEPT